MSQGVQQALLQQIDFDWTRRLESIWAPAIHHLPELHATERDEVIREMIALRENPQAPSPLGIVITGEAGAGKTHFIGALREQLQQSAFFVLVDMTDVSDFWGSVRWGYVDALRRTDGEDKTQLYHLLMGLMKLGCSTSERSAINIDRLAQLTSYQSLLDVINKRILQPLHRRYRTQISRYQDVIRALFLLNSEQFEMSDIGQCWLEGIKLEEGRVDEHPFRQRSADPKGVVEAISWLMSLTAPTLIAFDQLDSIVAQHNLASIGMNEQTPSAEERRSAAIVEGVAGGLMAIRDLTTRSLTLLSCLNVTWEILTQRAVTSFRDRFQQPITSLRHIHNGDLARQIIQQRISSVTAAAAFEPPHADWPFRQGAFDTVASLSPRELLKRCDQVRRTALRQGQFDELELATESVIIPATPAPALDQLTARFDQLCQQVDISPLLDEQQEQGVIVDALDAACRTLLQEYTLPDSIDSAVEYDGVGLKSWPALHLRLRIVLHNEHDRELHYSWRSLPHHHARAFQNRLQAAITMAGIEPDLSFRHLTLLRNQPIPSGRVTANAWHQFLADGGHHVEPSEACWRALRAIAILRSEQHPDFVAWAQQRRPMSQLAIFRASGVPEELAKLAAIPPTQITPTILTQPTPIIPTPPQSTLTPPPPSPTPPDSGTIPLGRQRIASEMGDWVALPINLLTRHTVVLASSGSGKSVLVRRLIEEAALQGIPAIVIDPANDLSRLGERWPEPPAEWFEGDAARAERFFNTTQSLIWTPGREQGRPIQLSPLPDFAPLMDDPDDLEIAITLAYESLGDLVASGSAASNRKRQAVLISAIRYLLQQGGTVTLPRLIALLANLPHAAQGGISQAEKLGGDMADLLQAAIATDQLLRSQGDRLDPAILFGRGEPRTRISVINLHALPTLPLQQRFVAQLAMSLFTWIKQHPATSERPVTGLLVIDEAKDFIPAQGAAESKQPLLRLAAQARKYGLGLIFATQAPRSIHHEAIGNCTTHIYGKASSPTARDVIQEQLRQRGSRNDKVSQLTRGHFYYHTEGLPQPLLMQTPLCLTHHAPMSEQEVMSALQQQITAETTHRQ